MQKAMSFCPDCGAPMRFAVPEGDDRKRNICTADGKIFYDNPRNIVGCIVECDDRILLCRRAIAPRKHFWTLPAGFQELGETTAQGAARETREEACARVTIDNLFSMLDIPRIGQVHMFYRARLERSGYAAGQETTAVALVAEADIPWRQLAFPTIYHTLQLYFADRAAGRFVLHDEAIPEDSWQRMQLDREPAMQD